MKRPMRRGQGRLQAARYSLEGGEEEATFAEAVNMVQANSILSPLIKEMRTEFRSYFPGNVLILKVHPPIKSPGADRIRSTLQIIQIVALLPV